MRSGRFSSERGAARGRRSVGTAAVFAGAAVLAGAVIRAQDALPPPPESFEPTPAPTLVPKTAGPRGVTCPRCGYRCETSWRYCISCGWDLNSLTGEEEEKRLQAVARATVGVVVGGRRNRFATAFPFGGSGLLLTNARYLIGADAGWVRVRTYNNREYPVSIVGYDLPTGIGVLRGEIPDVPPIELAPATPAPPESVWAVCFPVAFDDDIVHYLPVALHRGRLTATGQSGTFSISFENLLRTDHAIEEGCSGGPLIDSRGRIAGMILEAPDDGITYATPLEGMHEVVASLLRNEAPARPYFGMGLVAPDDRRRAKFTIDPQASQPLVAYLIPGSPADKAGLRPGDLLLSIGGEKVAGVWDAGRKLLAATPGGAGIALIVRRGGGEITATISPSTRPERVLLDPIDELQETLEANLSEVTTGPGAQQGLLLTGLVRGGRGEKDHYKNGDLIRAVGSKSVRTFAAFDEAIRTKFHEIFAGGTPGNKRFASSYVVTLEVRREGRETITRDYINFFPDILAPPVY